MRYKTLRYLTPGLIAFVIAAAVACGGGNSIGVESSSRGLAGQSGGPASAGSADPSAVTQSQPRGRHSRHLRQKNRSPNQQMAAMRMSAWSRSLHSLKPASIVIFQALLPIDSSSEL